MPAATHDGQATDTDDLSGTWQVGENSTVGYQVHEIIMGALSTISQRTDHVTGSLTVTESSVTSASFQVDVAELASNAGQWEALGVADHPEAELQLTEPMDIGTPPPSGATKDYEVTADLSFHDATRPVAFTVSAQHSPGAIDLVANIPITYADWGIHIEGFGPIGSLEPTATLEILLHLTR